MPCWLEKNLSGREEPSRDLIRKGLKDQAKGLGFLLGLGEAHPLVVDMQALHTTSWVEILLLLLTTSEMLGESLVHYMPQFPHLYNRQ